MVRKISLRIVLSVAVFFLMFSGPEFCHAASTEFVDVSGNAGTTKTFYFDSAYKGSSVTIYLSTGSVASAQNDRRVTIDCENGYMGRMRRDSSSEIIMSLTSGPDSWQSKEYSKADLIIPGGNEMVLKYYFTSDYKGDGKITIKNADSGVVGNGAYSSSAAAGIGYALEPGDTMKGYLYSANGEYKGSPILSPGPRYYSIKLTAKAIRTFKLTGDGEHDVLLDVYKSSTPDKSVLGGYIRSTSSAKTVSKTVTLGPGTYIVKVAYVAISPEAAIYSLNISGRNYITATGVKMSILSGKQTMWQEIEKTPNLCYIQITTIPSNADDTLKTLDWPASGWVKAKKVSGDKNSQKWCLTFGKRYSGITYYGQKITVKAATTNGHSKSLVFNLLSAPPKVPYAVTTYNSVNFKNIEPAYGSNAVVYLKVGSKWVKKGLNWESGSSIKVKGLKSNRSYKFKIKSVMKDGTPGGAVYKTCKTGKKLKAGVRKVSISGAKQSYIPREYHPGYWSGDVWINGYWTGGYWKTSYKISVKLNHRVRGATGIVVNGHKVSNKSSITVKEVVTGKYKGKKRSVTITPCSIKGKACGYGVSTTKKVTVR